MTHWLRRRFLDPLRDGIKQWSAHDSSLRAASISYYASLSLLPLLLVLLSGLGLFLRFTGRGQSAQQQLLDTIAQQVSPEAAEAVAKTLSEVATGAIVGGPLGVLTLLVAAAALFAQLERAFMLIWPPAEDEPRGLLRAARRVLVRRVRAFALLLLTGALLLVTFVGGIVVQAVARESRNYVEVPGWVWTLGHSLPSLLVNWLLLTVLYKVLPTVPVGWSVAARGGLLATIIWEVGRQVLSAFVITDRFSAYGVVGSFLAVMVWIYYASAVLLLGAEFAHAAQDHESSAS